MVQKCKKSFCVWRVSKKLKKIEKYFEKNLNFFFMKSILIIIYELCQHLGSLRSLWKAPETKTLGGALSAPPPYKGGVNMFYKNVQAPLQKKIKKFSKFLRLLELNLKQQRRILQFFNSTYLKSNISNWIYIQHFIAKKNLHDVTQ